MEITWFGYACCALTDDSTTIIADPYHPEVGLTLPELRADIVTVSQNNPRHNAIEELKGPFKVIDRPGEYEIQGIFISASALYPPQATGQAAAEARNLVFVYEIDEITVCHLGGLAHIPPQRHVETLNNVDVLLVPVGGEGTLNAAKASELIGQVQPTIVIPIAYEIPGLQLDLDPVDRFLKEMGQSQIEAQARLRLKPSTLPLEMQIVVLAPTVA